MKGLVLKDLLLMIRMDKKIILIMYFFAAAFAFMGENAIYTIMSSAFFSLFMGMHLMMTMTYDGMTSWKQYELTLPLNKYQIIGSKYLACLFLIPISAIGTTIIYIARYMVYHSFSFDQYGFSIVLALLLPILWCSVCLALAQWFGYMRVQYVRMACILFVILLGNKMSKDTALAVGKLMQNPAMIVIGVLGVIVVSYFASVTGYARKH